MIPADSRSPGRASPRTFAAVRDSGTSSAYRLIIALCITYVMLRPVSSGDVLYPVLAIVAVTSTAALLFGRRRASGEVVSVLGIVLCVALLGTSVGVANPGVWPHATVWVAGTFVYGAWALGADERLVKRLFTWMAWATVLLSLVIVLYVGANTGLIPNVVPAWVTDQSGAGFDGASGSTAIRLYGLSTLVAAAPMWVVASLLPAHRLLPPMWLRLTAALLAVSAALLGGRNAIVLVLILVPVVVLVLRGLMTRRRRGSLLEFVLWTFFLIALPMGALWASQNAAIQRTLVSISDYFAGGSGQVERVQQVDRLLSAWQQSMLFGQGFGAVIPGYARSAERPWNFEMQYHMLLFQLGVVGFAGVLVFLAFAVRALMRAIAARPDLAPVLLVATSAALAMIIANATNPYLQAPGHLWAIFFPLMIANIALTNPTVRETAPDLSLSTSRSSASLARRSSDHGRLMPGKV